MLFQTYPFSRCQQFFIRTFYCRVVIKPTIGSIYQFRLCTFVFYIFLLAVGQHSPVKNQFLSANHCICTIYVNGCFNHIVVGPYGKNMAYGFAICGGYLVTDGLCTICRFGHNCGIEKQFCRFSALVGTGINIVAKIVSGHIPHFHPLAIRTLIFLKFNGFQPPPFIAKSELNHIIFNGCKRFFSTSCNSKVACGH